uniref:Uncharacterized protein n=1 Tax=uncultured bacterium A1Q1_fos_2140 TaxID=1256565 RepID=L7VWY0_9BACT|nr:hypothetical protein [uncultured bacterium A1Q1_fos_2140]
MRSGILVSKAFLIHKAADIRKIIAFYDLIEYNMTKLFYYISGLYGYPV